MGMRMWSRQKQAASFSWAIFTLAASIFACSGSAHASDDSFEVALKLGNSNLLCSQLYGSVVLNRSSNYSIHPSSELCTVRNSVIKTKKGIRLLTIYSFTDEAAAPEHHGLFWVDIDCGEMLSRISDGYYHVVSKKERQPSRQGNVFRLSNGWYIYQKTERRREWESLKNGSTDRALQKACNLFSANTF